MEIYNNYFKLTFVYISIDILFVFMLYQTIYICFCKEAGYGGGWETGAIGERKATLVVKFVSGFLMLEKTVLWTLGKSQCYNKTI